MNYLESDIRKILNRHSAENGSNTPDYILAGYLLACLDAFDAAVLARESWHGGNPWPPRPIEPMLDPGEAK